VACTLGLAEIDAVVTAWDLAPRFLQAQANTAPSTRNGLSQKVGRSTATPQIEDSPVGAAC
jgi:hypothetical protein